MNYNSIKDLPLVIGNVLDENKFVDKAFAMTVDEIPYFIREHSKLNHVKVVVPVTEFTLVEVLNGVLYSGCKDEDLTELLKTLFHLQIGKQPIREFNPLCQT